MSGGQQSLLMASSSSETATITLHDDTYSQSTIETAAEAIFSLSPDGIAEGGPSGTNLSYTYRDGDIAANYEVQATLTVGTFTTGTAASWLNLGSEQTWTVRKNALSVGSKSATATFEIRKVGTSVVLDSATITLTAEVN